MENASLVALSRQIAVSREMDAIANNMANASTPGFKRESTIFAEYLAGAGEGDKVSFVQDTKRVRDNSEGPLRTTGGNLDFAIDGAGYFTVSTPLGPRYTRAGHFQLDAQNQIVTSDGYPLQGAGGAITVPAGARQITVARDGTLSVNGEALDTLSVAQFADEESLQRAGNGLFRTDAQPQAASGAKVLQGTLEDSNVQPVIELTRMMSVMRSFQAAQRLLESEHERERHAMTAIASPNS